MTSSDIERAIAEIRSELPGFSIRPENLGKFDLGKPEDREFMSYVDGLGGSYVKFLALLTKKLKPKNIVELGNREGLSTLAIYDQLPEGSRFTTVDIVEDQRYCPATMYEDPRVSFLFGDACSLDILKQVPPGIDLLFSDTIHYYFQIRDEFAIYQHLLADTALVAIDDIHTNDKGKFWDELDAEKWDLTELCHAPGGWGLFLFERKERVSPEERWKRALEAAALVWERKYEELHEHEERREERMLKARLKAAVKARPALYRALVSAKNRLAALRA